MELRLSTAYNVMFSWHLNFSFKVARKNGCLLLTFWQKKRAEREGMLTYRSETKCRRGTKRHLKLTTRDDPFWTKDRARGGGT